MEVQSSGTPPSAGKACSALDMIEELDLREDEGKEEDGETTEVSEDGESEREEDYNFQFEGEMDPLSFVEGEDSSRVPLYEVFQQIEDQYKALAAKKRPAPHENDMYFVAFFFLLLLCNFIPCKTQQN